jgi:hypothetical protein
MMENKPCWLLLGYLAVLGFVGNNESSMASA